MPHVLISPSVLILAQDCEHEKVFGLRLRVSHFGTETSSETLVPRSIWKAVPRYPQGTQEWLEGYSKVHTGYQPAPYSI